MPGTDDGMEVDEFPLVENHTPFTWDDVDATRSSPDHRHQVPATQPPTMRWERAALWSFGTASADGALASKSATSTGPQWTHHSHPDRLNHNPAKPSLASRMTVSLPRKKNKPSKKQRDARKRRLRALALASVGGTKVGAGEKKGKAKKWGGWKRAFERVKASRKRIAAVKRRLADLAKRIGGPPIKGLHDLKK